MNIINNAPQDKIILDVRTVEESAEGKIKWAPNILLDDLPDSLDRLEKDIEIIVHVGTGIRAQMD